jgi:hypothetical protein
MTRLVSTPEDFSSLEKLRSLSLRNVEVPTVPCLPHSLQHLSILGLKRGPHQTNSEFFRNMRRNDFSALKILSIHGWTGIFLIAKQITGTGNVRLDKLYLSIATNTKNNRLLPDIITSGCLAQATSLTLRSCDLTDDIAQMIPKFCTNLNYLDISVSGNLTKVGVAHLLAMAKERNLSVCEK